MLVDLRGSMMFNAVALAKPRAGFLFLVCGSAVSTSWRADYFFRYQASL
jgi:hypothetical protein